MGQTVSILFRISKKAGIELIYILSVVSVVFQSSGCIFSTEDQEELMRVPAGFDNYLGQNELKGRVKTIVNFAGEATRESCGKDIKSSRRTFDINGYITESLVYIISGCTTDDSNAFISRYTYSHDANGNITKIVSRDLYSNVDSTVYTYDVSTNLITKKVYDLNGSLETESLFDNSIGGKVIERMYFSEEGGIVYKNKYTYDTDGNMTERTHYNSEGVIEYTTIFEYTDGNVTHEKIMYSNGEIELAMVYSYNENGHRTGAISYIGSEERLQYSISYKCDEIGNWIEKTETYTGSPSVGEFTHVYRRNITYH
jgi:hypothetical protein